MRVSSTNQEMCVLSVAWSLGRRDAFTLGLLLKFIQAAELVKAHLEHSSVPAGTTPLKSAASFTVIVNEAFGVEASS